MFEVYQGYINFLIMKKSQRLQTLELRKLTISKLNQNQINGGRRALVGFSDGCHNDSVYLGATCD
jgi:hypothetical protein